MSIKEILDKHLIINHLFINPILTEKNGVKFKICDELLLVSSTNKRKFTLADHLIWIPLCKLHYGLTKKWKFIVELGQEQYRCILGSVISEVH